MKYIITVFFMGCLMQSHDIYTIHPHLKDDIGQLRRTGEQSFLDLSHPMYWNNEAVEEYTNCCPKFTALCCLAGTGIALVGKLSLMIAPAIGCATAALPAVWSYLVWEENIVRMRYRTSIPLTTIISSNSSSTLRSADHERVTLTDPDDLV